MWYKILSAILPFLPLIRRGIEARQKRRAEKKSEFTESPMVHLDRMDFGDEDEK